MRTSRFFKVLFSVLLTIVPYFLFAQNYCYTFGNQYAPQIIKTNLLALPFNSFNLEYERLWKPNISFGLGTTFTPKSGLPLKGLYRDYIDNETGRENLENVRYRHLSIKPSMRFYFGDQPTFTKLYTTVYLKYSRYSPDFSSHYRVNDSSTGDTYPLEINYAGAINSISLGYGVGLQFNVYDRFYLDWKIVGSHIGYAFGEVTGSPSTGFIPLSVQDNINETITKMEDFPIYRFSGEVNDTQAKFRSNGPIVGITMGLSIGYRFR